MRSDCSIKYIASALKNANVTVEIIDGWLLDLTLLEVCKRISEYEKIGWIGVSSYQSSLKEFSMFVKELKVAGVLSPIVAGGYGPTFSYEQFLDAGADYCVIGEGEATALELNFFLNQECGNPLDIRGLAFRKNLNLIKTTPRKSEENLDVLPLPFRSTIAETVQRRNPI